MMPLCNDYLNYSIINKNSEVSYGVKTLLIREAAEKWQRSDQRTPISFVPPFKRPKTLSKPRPTTSCLPISTQSSENSMVIFVQLVASFAL